MVPFHELVRFICIVRKTAQIPKQVHETGPLDSPYQRNGLPLLI